MVAKFYPFFTFQELPTKAQVAVTLAQVYRLLANQMVGAIAPSIGVIRDSNTPALAEILLGDNQRGGAYPLFVRLVYPTGTEDESFPLHLRLTRGNRVIHTAQRSAITTDGAGRRLADYEVETTSEITAGTWPDGFASIGQSITVDLLFEAPPEPEPDPYHTFSLVSGARDTFVGFWHNNIGTMEDRVYTLPNGNSTQIRQFMVGGSITAGKVRYLFGPARYQADQFPDRIVATNGANVLVLTKPTTAIISAGQGNGLDYDVESGVPGSVFNNGETINVEIFYDGE